MRKVRQAAFRVPAGKRGTEATMMPKSTILTNQQARNAVGALSVALGGVALVQPSETAGAFGVDRTAGPVPLLVRMIGVRNVTMGVRTLQSSGDEQTRTLKAGFVVGAVDTVAVLAAWRSGALNRRAAVAALSLLAAIAGLGIVAGRE